LLHEPIAAELAALSGRAIPVVDSADATAEELRELLQARALHAQRAGEGSLRLLVTDVPKRLSDAASRFLGRPLTALDVEAIDL
jgi:glutamate racemase